MSTLREIFTTRARYSALLMGLGQLMHGQVLKGALYMLIEAGFIFFFITRGFDMIKGFFTLGTVEASPWLGTPGDNSVVMLLMGILAFVLLALFIFLYINNIKDCLATSRQKHPTRFTDGVKSLLDGKFYKTVLFAPILGVCVFNVLPIIFMILIAFTNYGGEIVPPRLVDWTGLDAFAQITTLSSVSGTFFRILGWNLIWACLSTVLNYFLGLGLALLLNKSCVKGKAFWRAFPILAYAIPGFITLLAFRFMFSYGGPINQLLQEYTGSVYGFLDIDAKWSARAIGLLVNAWLNIPTSMLLATGVLSNMNMSLHEAAQIDGASPMKRFVKITLPFVIFATTPTLISQFIANFNNFGIFYFLRGGLYLDGYFLASDTDLLINWLYNLSISNNYYNIGAALSLIIFVFTSAISLLVYVRSSAYKKEDTYR